MNAPTSPLPVLNGRLRQHQLAPLLEFMLATSHTGTLELEGPGEKTSEVVVEAGNVVFASTEVEGGVFSRGIDALRAMLGWRFAYITLHDQLPANFAVNVKGTIMHVLLEAARLEDEQIKTNIVPEDVPIQVRFNISGYQDLGSLEISILQKCRREPCTVAGLRQTFPVAQLDATIIALIEQGLLEIEGFEIKDDSSISAESAAFLGTITPVRVNRHMLVRGAQKSLEPLYETVYALVDGQRSAERIRVELRISPGSVREALQNLRAAARIDY